MALRTSNATLAVKGNTKDDGKRSKVLVKLMLWIKLRMPRAAPTSKAICHVCALTARLFCRWWMDSLLTSLLTNGHVMIEQVVAAIKRNAVTSPAFEETLVSTNARAARPLNPSANTA